MSSAVRCQNHIGSYASTHSTFNLIGPCTSEHTKPQSHKATRYIRSHHWHHDELSFQNSSIKLEEEIIRYCFIEYNNMIKVEIYFVSLIIYNYFALFYVQFVNGSKSNPFTGKLCAWVFFIILLTGLLCISIITLMIIETWALWLARSRAG